MLKIFIPGFKKDELNLQHLMLDFNGTLATDGKLIEGVRERLNRLSGKLNIHILTGDTFGTAKTELKDIFCRLVLLPEKDQGFEKGKYTAVLGKDSVISIGNGGNDRQMLQLSAIGIVLIQKEGASIETLAVSDITCTNILDALDLINNPRRIIATLRN